MPVFSIPPYPGAISYNIQSSDPLSADVNGRNKFGPWQPLGTGSITSVSNIIDNVGDWNLRLYRVQPIVSLNGTNVTMPWYDPFTANAVDVGGSLKYEQALYDPLITIMLQEFRDFIGDYGNPQITATSDNLDTGAGSGLLQFDGTTTLFHLADVPDAKSAVVLEGTANVVKNGKTLVRNADYIVDYGAGTVQFATPPAAADTCYIPYREAKYSNRMLLGALDTAICRLSNLGINGYSVVDDNNVRKMQSMIPDNGLKPIIFSLALVILNRSMIRDKAENARAYKQDGFSMDTAPGRIVDGMSKVSTDDLTELRFMANNYIRSATFPIVRTISDGYFDVSGMFPSWPFLWGMGYLWYMGFALMVTAGINMFSHLGAIA